MSRKYPVCRRCGCGHTEKYRDDLDYCNDCEIKNTEELKSNNSEIAFMMSEIEKLLPITSAEAFVEALKYANEIINKE